MTKEELTEYNRKYQEANREVISKWRKQYNKANKNKVVEYRKKYHEANKEQKCAYYQANKERLREYTQANKERINERNKRRVLTDPAYRLVSNLRSRHNKVIKGATSTTKGLGCNGTFFRDYISAQWTEGMGWDNYGNREGQWSLDHIIPLDLYKTQPELLPKLIHYSNMQPMWHVDNIKKSNKVA